MSITSYFTLNVFLLVGLYFAIHFLYSLIRFLLRENSESKGTVYHDTGDIIVYDGSTNQVHSFDPFYPSITTKNGDMIWFKQGKLHSLYGAAFVSGDRKEYWIDGKQYSEDVWRNSWRRKAFIFGLYK